MTDLEVAMGDVEAVEVADGEHNLRGVESARGIGQPPIPADAREQFPARYVLQQEVQIGLILECRIPVHAHSRKNVNIFFDN
jgi:hypothetical protein